MMTAVESQIAVRSRVFSGAPWEKQVGYCRAVRCGNHVFVSGTTSVGEDGDIYAPGDAYGQAKRCFDVIEQSLKRLGCQLSDVVRTRMFVTDISRWEEFGRAHQEVFAKHPPATSMLEVKALINPQMLIEVEVDAVLAAACDGDT